MNNHSCQLCSAPMSATRLLLLGAVRIFQPVHGYFVRRELLTWHADSWAHLNPGSVYNGLRTLAREGFVEEVGTETEGGRPARTTYRLTADGEAEFMLLSPRRAVERVAARAGRTDVGVELRVGAHARRGDRSARASGRADHRFRPLPTHSRSRASGTAPARPTRSRSTSGSRRLGSTARRAGRLA